jgi:hypothetical protein
MAENTLTIGPIGDIQELSAFGRKVSIAKEDGLKREDRAADGTLRRDVIARKNIISISYDLATQDVVDRLEVLYEVDDSLQLTMNHLSGSKTYTVLMGEYSQDRLLAVLGGIWEGVSVEFREV